MVWKAYKKIKFLSNSTALSFVIEKLVFNITCTFQERICNIFLYIHPASKYGLIELGEGASKQTHSPGLGAWGIVYSAADWKYTNLSLEKKVFDLFAMKQTGNWLLLRNTNLSWRQPQKEVTPKRVSIRLMGANQIRTQYKKAKELLLFSSSFPRSTMRQVVMLSDSPQIQ